jgi:hypothetical protein
MQSIYRSFSLSVLGLGFVVPFLALEVFSPNIWTETEVLLASASATLVFSVLLGKYVRTPPTIAPFFLLRVYAGMGTIATISAGIFLYALFT